MMNGVELIAAERDRQIDREGWTAEHDDQHKDGSLALAAVCYATPVQLFRMDGGCQFMQFRDPWPGAWQDGWDKRPFDHYNGKPINPTLEQRLRMLAKAGALIAAEIDRLQRQTAMDKRTQKAKA